MLDMSAGFGRDMPSGTPGLKDISPKPDGGHSGPSVLLVAGPTAATIIITLLLLVSCILTIYFRWKKQLKDTNTSSSPCVGECCRCGY